MKTLVLGGCGFIGSHLVDRLLIEGHEVRILDRAPETFRQPLSTVEYRFGDFGDSLMLLDALDEVDVVYHVISTTVPSTSNLDLVADVQGNLINTVRLLQLMVQKGISKIVYLSSGGTVYGIPERLPIPETHPLHPICSYGVVKVAIENYIHMYHHLHGLKYVILRPSNTYGERQGHIGVQGVIGTFMRKIQGGEQIEVWGDGSVLRDYIYVCDLAELCVLAGYSNFIGVCNAGSGKGYSIKDIIIALTAVTGRHIEPVYKAGRAYDVPQVVLDITRAGEIFGWQPRTDFSESLGSTWHWINNRAHK